MMTPCQTVLCPLCIPLEYAEPLYFTHTALHGGPLGILSVLLLAYAPIWDDGSQFIRARFGSAFPPDIITPKVLRQNT
jgi:hypothetical protein